jgi:hypothetical protein
MSSRITISHSELEGTCQRAPHTSGFSWHRIATKTPSLSSGYTGTEGIFGLTKILLDFLQFIWSQVTSTKIYEIFRRSQGHKGSIRKILTNLTPKIRCGRPCGAVLYENFRKSHRSQARIRKDHFVFDITRQSAVRIERNGTVINLPMTARGMAA